ncbi:MAG: DUF2752 domain-containing protein [Candidatus Hydrogenedentes bacterium]|nr:DUF2752 domain-containing protein [Candidatus Hydrogenedentota bacterium]
MPDESLWRRLTFRERFGAIAYCLAVAAVLGLAATLTPDERGLGTHEQLGLGSCQMVLLFGIPCMFCGMTTTFALIMHGDFLDGILNQPVGALIALYSIISIMFFGVFGVSGKIPRGIGFHLINGRRVIGALSVLSLGWVYKLIAFFMVT